MQMQEGEANQGLHHPDIHWPDSLGLHHLPDRRLQPRATGLRRLHLMGRLFQLTQFENNLVLGLFLLLVIYLFATVLFVPGLLLTIGAGAAIERALNSVWRKVRSYL